MKKMIIVLISLSIISVISYSYDQELLEEQNNKQIIQDLEFDIALLQMLNKKLQIMRNIPRLHQPQWIVSTVRNKAEAFQQ